MAAMRSRFLNVGHGVRFSLKVIKWISCASCLELLKSLGVSWVVRRMYEHMCMSCERVGKHIFNNFD